MLALTRRLVCFSFFPPPSPDPTERVKSMSCFSQALLIYLPTFIMSLPLFHKVASLTRGAQICSSALAHVLKMSHKHTGTSPHTRTSTHTNAYTTCLDKHMDIQIHDQPLDVPQKLHPHPILGIKRGDNALCISSFLQLLIIIHSVPLPKKKNRSFLKRRGLPSHDSTVFHSSVSLKWFLGVCGSFSPFLLVSSDADVKPQWPNGLLQLFECVSVFSVMSD